MNRNLHLRSRDLRAFLEENSSRIAGRSGDEECCPITEFFRCKKNMTVRACHGEIIDGANSKNRRPMTAWEKKFVDTFDDYCEEGQWVSGEEALQVLDEVTTRKRSWL